MKKENSTFTKNFRKKAEELLKTKAVKVEDSGFEGDLFSLIHELEVHKIELELQTDEIINEKEKVEISEEKLNEFYDFAPTGYLTLSNTGEIIKVNFAAANMLAREREHLIKKIFALFLSEKSRTDFYDFFENIFANKNKQTCNIIISVKENQPLYVFVEGVVSPGGDECFLTLVDITEVLLTKEALEESEQKFSIAFDNSPIPISIFDVKSEKRLALNKKYCELFGYTKDELLNVENFRANNISANKKNFITLFKKGIKEGRIFNQPFTIKTKSGEIRHVLINGTKAYKNSDDVFIISYLDVTEERVTRIALEKSEQNFKNLAETANVSIAIFGSTSGKGYLYANQYWEKLTGYTKKEAENLDVEAIVAPEFKEIVKERARMRFSGKKVLENYELKIITKTGETKWVNFSATIIEFEGKKAILTTAHDNTLRKQVELKLRQSTLLLEASQKIAKVGGWELDIASGNLFWTNETYHIHDTSPSKFNPTVDAGVNYFLPESRKIISEALKLAIEKGKGYDLELETHTTKGRHIYVRTTCEVILKHGKPVKLIGIFQDITKQKLAEIALIKSKEEVEINRVYLDNIINNIGDPVFVKDEESRLLMVNNSFCELFRLDRDKIIGKTLVEHVSQEEREAFLKEDNRVIKIGKESIVEESLTVRDGPSKIISTRKTRYVDSNKNKFLIGVIRDITDRKNAQEQLENALNELLELKEQIEAENIYLKEELKLEGNFHEIIGTSKLLRGILKQVEQVAKSDTTVLVLGETGTGKELIAKAIHEASDRKSKPLIKVNCSALPAELIESELFGHEKGAFTGALNRKVGRFELADKGTIFLDEIGDLSINLQTRLLRVLQEREFELLGGEKTIKVDVRIITATNRDLEGLVIEGKFRQDLYYRLNVFPITCPPLRDRKIDIPILTSHFINKYNNKIRNTIKSIHKNSIDRLISYNWPGNIRELEHVIERAMILNHGEQLRLGKWFLGDNEEEVLKDKFITLEQAERNYITTVLEKTKGKIRGENGAAKILGLKPTTLESRIKKLNILKNG